MERAKDPVVTFRTIIRGTNSKGGTRLQLYLNSDEAKKLVEALTATLSHINGTKVDLHIDQRKTNDGSRTFESAYAFIKLVSEPSNVKSATPLTFKPKGAAATKAD